MARYVLCMVANPRIRIPKPANRHGIDPPDRVEKVDFIQTSLRGRQTMNVEREKEMRHAAQD